MAAFVIVDTKIEDAKAYERYKALAKPLAEKFGGQYRARGGMMEVIDDDLWVPTRMVVVEFPDMKSARRFVNSAEYAPVKAMRHAAAQSTLVILEG